MPARTETWIVVGAAFLISGPLMAERAEDFGHLASGVHLANDIVADSRAGRSFATLGKPTAPIELNYTYSSEPVANVSLIVELLVSSRISADSLVVGINTSNDTLLTVRNPAPIVDVSPGELHRFRVEVLPREEGEFFVHVIATLVRDGVSQSRAFSIPVQVGNATSRQLATKRLKIDDVGRPLVSSPARETGTGL
jgi:hypothetical protein